MKTKRADWVILAVSLLLFGGLSLYVMFHGQDGAYAVVTVDGTEIASYPLDTDLTTVIEGYDGGENVLEIKDGRAKIISADCPDGSCTHQKAIHADQETIVCLPHRVVVLIRSGEENEIDALTR